MKTLAFIALLSTALCLYCLNAQTVEFYPHHVAALSDAELDKINADDIAKTREHSKQLRVAAQAHAGNAGDRVAQLEGELEATKTQLGSTALTLIHARRDAKTDAETIRTQAATISKQAVTIASKDSAILRRDIAIGGLVFLIAAYAFLKFYVRVPML